jgi:hypothetical protein
MAASARYIDDCKILEMEMQSAESSTDENQLEVVAGVGRFNSEFRNEPKLRSENTTDSEAIHRFYSDELIKRRFACRIIDVTALLCLIGIAVIYSALGLDTNSSTNCPQNIATCSAYYTQRYYYFNETGNYLYDTRSQEYACCMVFYCGVSFDDFIMDDYVKYDAPQAQLLRVFVFHLFLTYLVLTHALNYYCRVLEVRQRIPIIYMFPLLLLPGFAVYLVYQEANVYMTPYHAKFMVTICAVLSALVVLISRDSFENVLNVRKVLLELRSHKYDDNELIRKGKVIAVEVQSRDAAIQKILTAKTNLASLCSRLNLKLKIEVVYTLLVISTASLYLYFESGGEMFRGSVTVAIVNSFQLFFLSVLQITAFQDEIDLIESENKVHVIFKINFFGLKINSSLLMSMMYSNAVIVVGSIYSNLSSVSTDCKDFE